MGSKRFLGVSSLHVVAGRFSAVYAKKLLQIQELLALMFIGLEPKTIHKNKITRQKKALGLPALFDLSVLPRIFWIAVQLVITCWCLLGFSHPNELSFGE